MAHDTTIRDVADVARVSMATVSNVLNHPDRVAAVTRERVETAIRHLDFVPHSSARQLARGRGRAIGLSVLDLANPFFTEVAIGVETAASEAGYAVFLCNAANSAAREMGNVRVLEEQRVSGVLLSPVGGEMTAVHRLRKAGIPVVLVDREGTNDNVCSVAVDDVNGGRAAGRHLIASGVDAIVFLGVARQVRQLTDRLRGLRASVRASKLSVPVTVLRGTDMNVRAGESHSEEVARMVAGGRRIGVAAGNDLLAIGLMRGLASLGVAVPNDVRVVGYDDIEMASLVSVPLTSVRQPMYEVGSRAAELLIEEIENDSMHLHRHLRFTPALVSRASTAA